MKIHLVYLLFLFSLTSCIEKRTLSEKFTGAWIIEDLNYVNNNYKDSLGYNMIFFKSKEIVKIPEISIYEQENAHWTIVEKAGKKSLNINSSNTIFNGIYDFQFIKDSSKQMLGVKLKSDHLYILAYKVGQDYLVDGVNW